MQICPSGQNLPFHRNIENGLEKTNQCSLITGTLSTFQMKVIVKGLKSLSQRIVQAKKNFFGRWTKFAFSLKAPLLYLLSFGRGNETSKTVDNIQYMTLSLNFFSKSVSPCMVSPWMFQQGEDGTKVGRWHSGFRGHPFSNYAKNHPFLTPSPLLRIYYAMA